MGSLNLRIFIPNKLFPQKGFTLIELLITVAIVLIMAVVAVPAFNRYQSKAEFDNKVDETKALINEAHVLAQNPEQGINRYIIYADEINKRIVLSKSKDGGQNSDEVKSVVLPSDMDMTEMNLVPSRFYVVFPRAVSYGCIMPYAYDDVGPPRYVCDEVETQSGITDFINLQRGAGNSEVINFQNINPFVLN